MCGICGLINRDSSCDSEVLYRMLDSIRHRGPDDCGVKIINSVGIGHRRLSIIDLEGGQQPMASEDELYWISFNGEIYNYKELRKVLLSFGHSFQTNSDTEVLLKAYIEWGAGCVSRMRGMFAFAILDKEKQELFLARDQFGIKPLVYTIQNNLFAFASELQALRQIPDLPWEINITAVDQFLKYQFIPAPNTIYKDTYKLLPGQYLRVGLDGKIKEIKQYWQLDFKPDNSLSEQDWLEQLDEVIKDSVKAHLVSDVPFGAFLSGGIDSSLVVGYMAEIMQRPVKTFSIGFEEEGFSELAYARQVSQKWQTDHHEMIVKPDALGILPDLVSHYGEPFGDSSAIPTYYVSKLAREHVPMVLTGDAGDELFAGYESYTTRWIRHSNPIPEHLPRFKKMLYGPLSKLLPSKYPLRTATLPDWYRYIQYFDDSRQTNLWREDYRDSFNATGLFHNDLWQQADQYTHFQKAQFLDFNTYLPYDILTKVDIASMMHSLETRTPLLDIKIVELAASIPEHLNINKNSGHWEGKILLKKLLRKHFDHDFVYRKKMGFAVPITKWFSANGQSEKVIKERLLDTGNGLNDFFQPQAIEQIAYGNHAGQQWLMLFLQEWLNQSK